MGVFVVANKPNEPIGAARVDVVCRKIAGSGNVAVE